MQNQWHCIYTSLPTLAMHQASSRGWFFGNVLRIHQLCSHATDIVRELKLFFRRLLDQGYQSSQLMLLFQQAMDNTKNYLRCTALDHFRAKSRKDTAHCCRVFLHLPYHQTNPSSKSIQKLWHDVVATPNGQTPLHCLTNQQGYNVPIEWLTNAWHRSPNLGSLLSYRKLENRTGLKVSSFIKTWDKYTPNFLSRGGRLWHPALCSKKYYDSALWMIPSICERET